MIWQDREIKEEKKEKKKDHQGHTDDLFLTHSVLLERSHNKTFLITSWKTIKRGHN